MPLFLFDCQIIHLSCASILKHSISVHVDDTSVTEAPGRSTWLTGEFERRFGTLKNDANRCEHYVMHVSKTIGG